MVEANFQGVDKSQRVKTPEGVKTSRELVKMGGMIPPKPPREAEQGREEPEDHAALLSVT